MAKSFLKKNPTKGLGGTFQNSAIRGGGTLAAGFVNGTVMPKLKFIPAQYRGLATLALGLAGEALIDNDTVKTFAEGVTCYGTLRAAGDTILSAQKSTLGLAGVQETIDADYQEPAPKALAGWNWEQELNGADLSGDEGGDVAGIDDGDDELSGLEGSAELALRNM